MAVLIKAKLALQLLEEICNLGRAPEYVCQKPSIQKADGTVAVPPARSSHAAEEASSEDEEEEEALHTFSQQQGEPESNRQSVPLELYDTEFITHSNRTTDITQIYFSNNLPNSILLKVGSSHCDNVSFLSGWWALRSGFPFLSWIIF